LHTCLDQFFYSTDSGIWTDQLNFEHSSGKLLSVCFNGHFPGGPALADTGMSPFWMLLELMMMEVVVTTGAITHAKLHSDLHHQQTNTQLFTGQMPFLSPNQQFQGT